MTGLAVEELWVSRFSVEELWVSRFSAHTNAADPADPDH